MNPDLGTPPFDPDYAGIGHVDIDRAWGEHTQDAVRDIPERFVYDAPIDAFGLAEMSGPDRDDFISHYDEGIAAFHDALSAQWDDDPNPYHGDYSEM